MKENVLNLEVVLADGTVIDTAGKGRHVKKSSAGYNLTELFVGSEGTLGIITKVTLRLHPQPEVIGAAVCQFPEVDDAIQSTIEALQYNIPLARIELLDNMSIKAVNGYSSSDLDVTPTLFIEFHGSEASVTEQKEYFRQIVEANNCLR